MGGGTRKGRRCAGVVRQQPTGGPLRFQFAQLLRGVRADGQRQAGRDAGVAQRGHGAPRADAERLLPGARRPPPAAARRLPRAELDAPPSLAHDAEVGLAVASVCTASSSAWDGDEAAGNDSRVVSFHYRPTAGPFPRFAPHTVTDTERASRSSTAPLRALRSSRMASVERRPGAETAERRPAQVIKQFPEFAKNLLANLPAEMRREQDDLKASAAPDAPPRHRPLALAATDGRAGVRVRDRSWGRGAAPVHWAPLALDSTQARPESPPDRGLGFGRRRGTGSGRRRSRWRFRQLRRSALPSRKGPSPARVWAEISAPDAGMGLNC